MTASARLIWLFDVDGTLLSTDGAARGIFAQVIGEWLEVEDDLAGVAFAGRTDPLILADILARHGRDFDEPTTTRFWHEVSRRMESRLPATRARLLPGVAELLDAVAREPGWVPALLTGNTSHMARVKLGHFAIHERFAFGAFGEEAADRNALACVAVERAARDFGVAPDQCVVLGDTEHDVACARAAGAHAVAVATGARDREALAAVQPDLLLDDFTQQAPLFEWARRIERR
jgi:phosphoglycolate phosphatase-like HAD superfamily hydrolase